MNKQKKMASEVIKIFCFSSSCKKIIIQIFVLLLCVKSFCLSDFQWNISVKLGIKSGKSDELVFENGEKISLLKWDVPCIPQINIKNQIELKNCFFDVEYITGIPLKSGKLNDYDYLTGYKGLVSHFSEHDLYVDKNYSINAGLGFKIECNEIINVVPFIGISYLNCKFSAQDGYLQYPLVSGSSWTGKEEKEKITGTVISYEQSILLPLFGLRFCLKLNEMSRIGIEGSYYPFISANTLDSHFLRQVQFYDTMEDGKGGKLELYFIVYPLEKSSDIKMKLSFLYEKISCKGQTSSSKIGTDSTGFVITENTSSGLDSDNFCFSVGMILAIK